MMLTEHFWITQGTRHAGTTKRRRTVGVATCVLALLPACAGQRDYGDSPGTNLRVGDLAVRYVHFEDPPDEHPYPPGSDVRLYAWFFNDGISTTLAEVSSPVAARVSLSEGTLPVQLPTERLVALGPRSRYLVLEDIQQEIAGYEFVPVEMIFGNGKVAELMVEAVEVAVEPTSTVDVVLSTRHRLGGEGVHA